MMGARLGEVCITATSRNLKVVWQPGSHLSCLSRTVAASAIAGHITDPEVIKWRQNHYRKSCQLGDQVNTDVISPARWMREGLEYYACTPWKLSGRISIGCAPGNIIVGGRNFVVVPSEPATAIMKVWGQPSLAFRTSYYRNCIAFGIGFAVDGISQMIDEGKRWKSLWDG